jgi:UDP-glucuronate 4-epimerase
MALLITGVAGFIGSSVAMALLDRGEQVIGIDNLNDYYDPALKLARLERISAAHGNAFTFEKVDFSDQSAFEAFAAPHRFDRIVHLGAQAGVRYSLVNPKAYVRANLMGQINLLELARHRGVDHFIYASSSSVYGPWGRPDMAMWIFTKALFEGRPLNLFNGGDMRRDFTFIDDIVSGVLACIGGPPADDGQVKAGGSKSPHAVYNIGNHRSEELMRMVELLEQATGKTATFNFQPMQPGDVKDTFADIGAIQRDHGFEPRTTIDEGVPRFVDWFKQYHHID